VQSELLDQHLAAADKLVQRALAILGGGELEHLHLVELVAADGPALLAAVAAGLAAVAGRVGEHLDRQALSREDLVAVDVDDGRLGCGEQEGVPAAFLLADVEDVVVELGELPGGIAGLLGEQVRGQQELIPGGVVLAIEEIQQRPLQRRALPGVDPVPVAAELGAPCVVDESETSAELHVVEWLVPEVGLGTPGADDLVGFLSAGRGTLVRQVGQLHEQLVEGLLGRCQAGRHLRDLVAEGGGLLLRVRGIGPRRLQPADLLRLPVPL
jgi:hypothetical protein